MRKRNVTLLVLLLVIGFASVSTSLILNGTIGIGANKDDFDVVFTNANGEDGSTTIISEDGKSISFSTSELRDIDQESVLNYEVTNKSKQYDVDVEIQCGINGEVQNVSANEYVTIEVNPHHFELEALDKTRGTVNIRLNRVVIEDKMQIEFNCKLIATAKSRNDLAEAEVRFNSGSNTIDIKASSDGEVIFNAEDISNKTNILCNNGAIPTIDGETIKVSNVTSKTKCYLNDSLVDINNELDESKTNILMLNDELDIPDSGECTEIATSGDDPETVAVCINKDYNDIVLDLNGKKITSSTKITMYIQADSKFSIKGSGYIGNNADYGNIKNASAILIGGAELYIESSKADKCTNSLDDTTSGLCISGETAINNWPAKSKSYTFLKNISTNGQIVVRNGNAELSNMEVINNNTTERGYATAIAIVDTAEDVTINGGHYESLYGNVISDSSKQGNLVINNYPTYIRSAVNRGIYQNGEHKLVINSSEANACTENSDELMSGLCMYGNSNVYLENGVDAIINGGTYYAKRDTIHVRFGSSVEIKGGKYLSNNTKALTCRREDTTCYVSGGTFENKNLGEDGTTVNWGVIANEEGAKLYLSNVTLIGKYPLRIESNSSNSKNYICSGTFNSSSGFDILNNSDAPVYYSSLVKFTDLSNTPNVSGLSSNVIGNYTGMCTP